MFSAQALVTSSNPRPRGPTPAPSASVREVVARETFGCDECRLLKASGGLAVSVLTAALTLALRPLSATHACVPRCRELLGLVPAEVATWIPQATSLGAVAGRSPERSRWKGEC